jgi:ATP adenylyltransferase
MNYSDLKEFLAVRMKMSHIYQPAMIYFLLSNNGQATATEIAEALLKYDPSQIEYYENITKHMVGRVLAKHKIVTRSKRVFELLNFNLLTSVEIDDLKALCEQRLKDYIQKRGTHIWEHRRVSRGYIPGSIKYEVLKRAQFRCELCGISASEKALEVDHIVPINLGGEDSINNYQALCYSCNASKRDTDTTDFRNSGEIYNHREEACLFCNLPKERIVMENNLAYVIEDAFPVAIDHRLIIPKRHFSDYFELKQAEFNAVQQLLFSSKTALLKQDTEIQGFNIGVNSGEVAGQTIMHCHIHLIPRRKGDVENPRGGIRHTIPNQGFY